MHPPCEARPSTYRRSGPRAQKSPGCLKRRLRCARLQFRKWPGHGLSRRSGVPQPTSHESAVWSPRPPWITPPQRDVRQSQPRTGDQEQDEDAQLGGQRLLQKAPPPKSSPHGTTEEEKAPAAIEHSDRGSWSLLPEHLSLNRGPAGPVGIGPQQHNLIDVVPGQGREATILLHHVRLTGDEPRMNLMSQTFHIRRAARIPPMQHVAIQSSKRVRERPCLLARESLRVGRTHVE